MDVHTFKEINFRKSLYNNYLHFIFSVPKIGYKFLKIGYAFPPPATVSAPAAIPAGFLSLPSFSLPSLDGVPSRVSCLSPFPLGRGWGVGFSKKKPAQFPRN